MPTLLRGHTGDGAQVRVDLVSDKGDGLWECYIRQIRNTEPGIRMTLAGGQVHAEVVGLNSLGTGHVLRLDVRGQDLIKSSLIGVGITDAETDALRCALIAAILEIE